MKIDPWKRNLGALWLAQTVTIVCFSFVFPFIPLYVQKLGVPDPAEAAQWGGVIAASMAVSMTIMQPIWGNLADRWGRRQMVIRAMVSGGIITILTGFTTSPEQLLVLRFIQGAVAGSVPAANALVAGSTPKHRLGFALGLMQVALFVGMSVGPLVGGILADTLGYRAAFYGAGVLPLLGAVIVFLFVRENFVRPPAGTRHEGMWAGSRSLLALSIFPILIGVVFLIQFGGVIVSPVLSLFIADLSQGENAATTAGIVLAATGGMSAVSALVIGRLSDRVGQTLILPICLVGAALTYFPQAFVHEVWQLLLLRMLLGVFLGGLMPCANALVAGMVPPERRGAAFGLTSTASALANAAGPLSGAAIASHLGFRAVFLATGILFTLASCWVSLGFRRHALLGVRRQVREART